jgi:hypothetical protein
MNPPSPMLCYVNYSMRIEISTDAVVRGLLSVGVLDSPDGG